MEYTQIGYEVTERIATVTLDRAEARNGYTIRMADEAAHALRAAGADDDVRVIVLTGAGNDFCVGADLSDGGLDVTETDDLLKLNQIVSEQQGQGHASEALDSLVEYADETGKPVFLSPSAIAEGLSQEELVAWYRRHGFSRAGKMMVHEAAVVACALSADELDVLAGTWVP